MATEYLSMANLKFLLHEVHRVKDLFQYERYRDFDEESIDMLVEAAKELGDKEYFPYLRAMDEQPVRYENGKVISHPQLANIFKQTAEGGWIGATADSELGGMQTPVMAYGVGEFIFQAANNGAQGYIGLTVGASRLIMSYGSRELVDAYVPNMFAGKWQGTMALTEPQAGSSMTEITTAAEPAGDGHYKISGQKIFISGGDHLACENFVHLTLARIKGAPAGVKGISLFVIPKYRPEASGTLVDNDVKTAGDFQKMGQRGYATTHLVFGENGNCRGELVGEPNKGLAYMFQMMNEARISVGLTAAAIASAAYYAALEYAHERAQGKPLDAKSSAQGQTLIINHPDVRRMLLAQKAFVEGSMGLAMECFRLADLCKVTSSEEKENHLLLLECLTPIMKAHSSEQGVKSTSLALQVFGGYGYTVDYPVEQYYRDIRILSIYEGTTGIQSLDLLGRKITMQNGKAFRLLMQAMQATVAAAGEDDVLKPYTECLGTELQRLQNVVQHLLQFAKEQDYERFLADATVFMELIGTVVFAWQWLKQGMAAQGALSDSDRAGQPAVFYESKIQTMKFYFAYELPHVQALARTLLDGEALTLAREQEILI